MCTGISNVMNTDVKHVNFNGYDGKLYKFDVYQNTTTLAPYCQNVRLRYRYNGIDISTYWLNINTTASSIKINDDTQKFMNISEFFQYTYNTSLSIPNNNL